MTTGTHTHWRMTINNYDETDLALVQQAYPDYIRRLVYTLERGKEGTPHIQAYIKMNRDCRFAFMRKLFPRGNFAHIDSSEYRLNSERYAQKLDATAESPAVIINHAIPDPVRELCDVIRDALLTYAPTSNPTDWRFLSMKDIGKWRLSIQHARVAERPMLAKFYVSPIYSKVWKEYSSALVVNVIDQYELERGGKVKNIGHTHTHTHTDEKFSHVESKSHASEEPWQDGSSPPEGSEEGEDDEGDYDSSGSETETGTESDDSGCSESDAESED